MDKFDAITRVLNAWGVPNEDRMTAIRIILSDKVDSAKVVEAIEEIANGLAWLKTLEHDAGLVRMA